MGVLGGSFNPIHSGHLLMAESARIACALDKVLFIPANIPPHKDFTPEISDGDRLKLIRLAIRGNPHFDLSDMELKRGGVSYTIDTVKALYLQLNPKDRIYLILGGDLVEELATWKHYEDLKSLVDIVVVEREGEMGESYEEYDITHRVPGVGFNVSSSRIRERLAGGQSIKYLVPEKVEDYILSRGLYRQAGGG
ncbi:MAG: nicotinate (nicotinamide) nucleotide adenylyltransferase [Spirochaetota bacterium]|nr:nicotinate (nicotinamide) nucleotide adenylyltransferase [Spirochaetota bacterium]